MPVDSRDWNKAATMVNIGIIALMGNTYSKFLICERDAYRMMCNRTAG